MKRLQQQKPYPTKRGKLYESYNII